MIFIIFIINIPWVSWIPQVLFDTARFTGRVRYATVRVRCGKTQPAGYPF